MSRYRRSDMDLAYGELPPQRWDAGRYQRESQNRAAPVIEQRPPYNEPRGGGGRTPYYEEQRYYEDDQYGPRGSRQQRYYEEEDFYDPRASGGAVIPFRPARPARPQGPPRPGIVRRQSSLDTFDRRPMRRFDDYEDYRPAPIPPPSRRTRYDDRGYDDVRVQDPDRYGDDGFREYREREWVRTRRNESPSPERREEVREEVREEIHEEVRTDIRSPEPVEKPYPRKGKTKMPKRLVHTRVLFDLGYPFYEENEKTIIIEKALGPDNIDEVFSKSKEYRERESVTTLRLEAPPPSAPSFRDPSPPRVVEERRFEEAVFTKPISEAPRSVRDWDALSRRSPSPTSRTVRSHSRRRSRRSPSRRGSSDEREVIIEKKTIIERDISPARTEKTATTRRRGTSVSSGTEIVERRIVERDIDDSNSIHVGPLALVVDRSKSRSDRDIKEEIRRLEAERRNLRKERKYERETVSGTEIVKIERTRRNSSPGGFVELREPSPRGQVVIERRGEELIEVRKDRRERSRSRPAPPSSRTLKAMMATLT